mgnify:CR=1 FL=1
MYDATTTTNTGPSQSHYSRYYTDVPTTLLTSANTGPSHSHSSPAYIKRSPHCFSLTILFAYL